MTFPVLSDTISLDLETRDEGLDKYGPGWCYSNGGEIVGVAIGSREGQWYLPPDDNTRRWLKDVLNRRDLTVVMHNALYDRGWLTTWGITPRATLHDSMNAVALCDEYRMSYSLDACGKDYVGEGKDDAELKEMLKRHGLKKNEMWKLPFDVMSKYAKGDARVTLKLWDHMLPLLEKEELMPIYNLEMNLQPVLLAMRAKGVRVDQSRAGKVNEELKREEAKRQKELNTEAGMPVDVWVADSLAKAFDKANIKYKMTPKTNKPSFTKDYLKEVGESHKVAKLVLGVRKLNKLRTTFVEGYVMDHAFNGRVHAVFSPLRSDEGGAVTGRFSSSNPNLQNLPAKDDYAGPLVRGLFLPEPGELWAACDYSQQEPRLAVHFAEVARVRGARLAGEAYRNNPDTDFHQMVADLAGIPRDQAKTINLGLMYGMGGAKLCRSLGLPTKWIEIERKGKLVTIEVAGDEGQAILDQYHSRVPFVRALSDECTRRARRRQYIRTLLGRRCRFGKEGEWHNKAFPYQAMNRLIQGSAADQSKAAMIEMFKEGIVPLVAVHDEIGLSTTDKGERAKDIMLNVVQLRVPSKVDVALGKSWGKAA